MRKPYFPPQSRMPLLPPFRRQLSGRLGITPFIFCDATLTLFQKYYTFQRKETFHFVEFHFQNKMPKTHRFVVQDPEMPRVNNIIADVPYITSRNSSCK